MAHGKTTISFFPSAAVKLLAGSSSETKLAASIQSTHHTQSNPHPHHKPFQKKPRSSSITSLPNQSIFFNIERQKKLPQQGKIITQRSELTLLYPLLSVARCAYVGTFRHTVNGQMYSVKIIAKHKAAETRARMDSR